MEKICIYFLICQAIKMAASLTCGSCKLTNCPLVTECVAGMVMDECNCCPVCAQSNGDTCGGKYELMGKCGLDLFCYHDYRAEENSVGICKKCDEVIYSGCSIIQGVCQCGDSCTHAFDYSDRESCMNSVQAYGEMNYCLGKSCPQEVSAEAICPDDSYRPPSKLTMDGCCQITQPCKCLESSCHPPPTCSEGKRVAEISRGTGMPGTCCSQYTCIDSAALNCEVGNSSVSDGQVVSMNDCRECRCKDGMIACSGISCQTPACEWSVLLPGKCCPECQGCMSAVTGENYVNGESWEEQNSCVQCQCVRGQTHCTASSCERRCKNPKMVAGRCCPVCDEDEVIYQAPNATEEFKCPESLSCPSDCKKKVTVEINGCAICLCEDDLNMCEDSVGCDKICPHGYKKDMQIGCSYCRCNACPPFTCNKVCVDGYAKDSEGCNKCQCKEGEKVTEAGVCFTSGGHTYDSGAIWFDGCRRCYCDYGREMCSLIVCPILNCSQPVVKVGDCCPSCASDSANPISLNISTSCTDADGSKHVEGDAWQLDTCTACICNQGTALCETQSCPPTLCTHPIQRPGHCCPECSGGFESEQNDKGKRVCVTSSKTKFEHGSIWKVGDCQSCTCQNGLINCFSQTCPILQCEVAIQQKGKCCPQCTGQNAYGKVCVYEGMWYKHLDTWTDDNMQCTCYHGQADCESIDCVGCSDALINVSDKHEDSTTIIGMPAIIILLVLLLLFAVIIVLLVKILMHLKRKEKSKPTAIPRILERRAITTVDHKKRPKSTNLEFLHSTSDGRYNNVNADTECCRPLVDTNHSGNEYVQC